MPTISQTQSIGNWTVNDFNESHSHSTERFQKSVVSTAADRELSRLLTKTQEQLMGMAASQGTMGAGGAPGAKPQFLTLRNKLGEAAHMRTTQMLDHHKHHIQRHMGHSAGEIKILKNQLIEGNSELARMHTKQQSLRQQLEADKEELAMIEKGLGMFDLMAGGTIVDNMATAKKKHVEGIGICQQDFGYNPIFRRPGDSFKAESSYVMRVKLPNGK